MDLVLNKAGRHRTWNERVSCKFKYHCRIMSNICIRALSLLPEGPVMLAVGLHVAKIETETLGDVEHIAEVQADGVEQHGCHADFIQRPHIVTAA